MTRVIVMREENFPQIGCSIPIGLATSPATKSRGRPGPWLNTSTLQMVLLVELGRGVPWGI